MAAEAGLTFVKMLTRAGVAAATKAAFVTEFALADAPAGDDDAAGARYLSIMARRAPDQVRCVITLGSPFAGVPRASNAWQLYERVSRSNASATSVTALLPASCP